MAIDDYFKGEYTMFDICKKYQILDRGILKRWIRKYNGNNKIKSHNKGDRIMTNGRKTTYKERIEIVSFCIANANDYNLTANKFNVSYQQVYTWVRKYNKNGHDALVDRRGKNKPVEELSESEKFAVQLKLLEAENKRLKMENDYLKKLEGIERRLNINKILNSNYNHKRIYRLMSSVKLTAVIRRKRKRYIQSTPQITAENILSRKFIATKPNEKWLTDVTEFKLSNGTKAYLSAILDLADNSIISYVLGKANNNKLVFDTLDKAIETNPTAKPLFHSDRGFQYTSKNFKRKLDKIEAIQSMSRVGKCIDNGPMEAFWGTLKVEMYYLQKFDEFEDLEQAIINYIEFYNTKRLQKRLKGMAPTEYRSHTLAA
jgi:transposase InsO family protein